MLVIIMWPQQLKLWQIPHCCQIYEAIAMFHKLGQNEKNNKQNFQKQQLTKSHTHVGVNLSISLLLFHWSSLPTEEKRNKLRKVES